MSRAIMISIQPKWVEKILNGEKTIEIRKTMPKCELPIDVYIYCTKDPKHLVAPFHFKQGWAYREYNDNTYYSRGCTANVGEDINGKVIAKFTLKDIDEFYVFNDGLIQYWIACDLEKGCVPYDDLANYIGRGKKGYSWHIDNLEIFDKPKELKDFYKVGFNEDLNKFNEHYKWRVRNYPEDYAMELQNSYDEDINTLRQTWIIKKAPQSWQFVEVE